MERINVMVSDEAKEVLRRYKREENYSNYDVALDALLLEFGELHEKKGE